MRTGKLPVEYSRQVRRRFGLWPTWLPESTVSLGDFGRVRDGLFVRDGGLGDLGLALPYDIGAASSDQLFASQGVRQVALDGGASHDGTQIGASIRIEFGRSFGVFVGLRGCQEKRTRDLLSLAFTLHQLRTNGPWDDDYCVITSLVAAKSALIAVSTDSGGALELRTRGPIPDILSRLDGNLTIASESHIGYRSIITTGCTPLFQLVRLASAGELVPRGASVETPRLVLVDPRSEQPMGANEREIGEAT